MNLNKLGVSGEQFVFNGWFRPYGKGDTIGVVQINDYNNSKKFKIVYKAVSKDILEKREICFWCTSNY